MLNFVWVFFFLSAFAVALCKLLFLGDQTAFAAIIEAMFGQAKTGSVSLI